MTITIPNITHGEELLSAFRKLPGNADGTMSDLYAFLEKPTPERDSFLLQHTQGSYSIQNRISTLNLRPV